MAGLLGPSGSGKSTLIRSIVGVQIVEGGTVTVLGRPAGSPSLRSRVGYVTQAPSVYGDLTVRENLGYFGQILRDRTTRGVYGARVAVDVAVVLALTALALLAGALTLRRRTP